MSEHKRDDQKGELNRRWRAILDGGHMSALRSEGRLAALYVLHMANWRTCHIRLSVRRAAAMLKVHPTTIRRGVSQMVEVGMLRVLDKQGENKVKWYEVVRCAHSVPTPGTSGDHQCAQAVPTTGTSGAHSAHTVCPPCAQPVSTVRTLCARNSISSIGSPMTTNDGSSEASPSAGRGPASARLDSLQESGK